LTFTAVPLTIPRLMALRRAQLVPADRSTPSGDSDLPPRPLADRWWGKVLLLLLGTLLLSLAVAPFKQYYAAWIGLVPWLIVVRHSRGPWRAALWSWLAGILYFSANMWWLAFVTGPGLVALMAVLGAYWAGAGAVLWPTLRPSAGTGRGPAAGPSSAADTGRPGHDRRLPVSLLALLPVVWVGFEWLRGTWPFSGLPWLYMAHTQSPALYLCQVADTTGELGVSAWVALMNGLVALFVFNGWRLRGLLRPTAAVVGVTVGVLGYGMWRFAQTPGVTTPGPRVLVVQPNYPQDNTGEKSAPMGEIVDFHLSRTSHALDEDPSVDLAVWSETMMPPLNPEARAAWRKIVARINDRDPSFENLNDRAHLRIADLARRYKCGLLVGTSYVQDFNVDDKGYIRDTGRRNSAVLYQRDTGEQAGRFDKIHTVPFGEYIPFKEGFPWLYRQMIALGPPNMESYQLTSGDKPVVFTLPKDRVTTSADGRTTWPAAVTGSGVAVDPAKAWRFVTPICFEDIDGDLVAWMFRDGLHRGSLPQGPDGSPTGSGKAADLIVNITNDGWFGVDLFGPGDRWYRGGQMAQHLQVATFRSIENRVPTARAVNTGISGFIDSLGRTDNDTLIPTGIEGTLAAQVMLDSRTTFYTQWGNLIGPACGIATAGMVLARVGKRLRRRRLQPQRGGSTIA
jgi:apolipoprotein N-acyltransferase